MQQRRLGRSGLAVSHLGLGTMTWGTQTDPDEAAALLVAFHDAGGTLIDTTGGGVAEEILGGLLADVVPREHLVLAAKSGVRRDGEHAVIDASRGGLLDQLERTLRNLGVDHLDLWQVHEPDPAVAPEETLSALDAAVTAGKARYAGVSNYAGWQTGHAVAWQRAVPGRAPIAATQVRYSLLERGVEREVLPACAALGVGVLPFAVLGGGVLTGKYRAGVPSDSRAASGGRTLTDPGTAGTVGIVEAVATAAEGLATSPTAVALAWVRDAAGVTAPVVGARTLGQLTAALVSETLVLPMEIRSALDDVSAPVIGYPESVH